MTRRVALSVRAQSVLRLLRDQGPLTDARDPRIAALVPSEAWRYDSLVTLHRRMLVRWDDGGRNIRITRRGRDILTTAVYRAR